MIKKGSAANAPAKPKATSSQATTKVVPTYVSPGEGTSTNPGVVLGVKIFLKENLAMAEKLLQWLILRVDKEAVENVIPQLGIEIKLIRLEILVIINIPK